MIAILAGRRDAGARAVHHELSRRVGADRVVRVLPTDLVRARWSHRVSESGAVVSRVRLPPGRDLAPDAVLHRLEAVPAGSAAASARDRDYAASEFDALVASWLLGLGHRVLGPTGAYATALGPSPASALAAAERCGLPVARSGLLTRAGLIGPPAPRERHLPRIEWPGVASAPVPVDVVPDRPVTSRLLVVADRVHGPLADRFGATAQALAAALGTNLLELAFADGPAVVGVTTMPQLDTAGQVHVVAATLVAVAGTAGALR